jgi:hypothetical protein
MLSLKELSQVMINGRLGGLCLKRQSCFKVRLFTCDGASFPNPHGIGGKGPQAEKAQNGKMNQMMFHNEGLYGDFDVNFFQHIFHMRGTGNILSAGDKRVKWQ